MVWRQLLVGEVTVVVKGQVVEDMPREQQLVKGVVVVQERVEVEHVPIRVLSHGSQLIQERTPFLRHFLSARMLGRRCRCHLVLSLLTTIVS